MERQTRRQKVIVCVTFVFTVLIIWMLGIISINSTRYNALEIAKTSTTNMSAALAEEIFYKVRDIEGAMTVVADQIITHRGNLNLYSLSDQIKTLVPFVNGATLVGPDGRLRSSTMDRQFDPIDLSDQEHIRVQLDGAHKGIFIGKPIMARTTHDLEIPISMRLESKDGHFLGVLVFLVQPRSLTTLHSLIELGPHGFIGISGSDHVIRARFSAISPNGYEGVGQTTDAPQMPANAVLSSSDALIHLSNVDHIYRIVSNRGVSGYPLFVGVGLGYDNVMASANRYTKWLLAAMGISTLLLIELVMYLIQEVNRREEYEIVLNEQRLKLEAANKDLEKTNDMLEATNIELESTNNKLAVTNENLMTAKDRAEAANVAKSMFLANMSHELRTPLNAIIGFAQLIEKQILGPISPPAYTEYATNIWTAGDHLLELISNVLDLSRIEAGMLDLKEEPVDTAKLVQSAMLAVRVQAEKKSITLAQCLPESTFTLYADSLRLRQILINLLANAVKFTPNGGRVAVSFEMTRIGPAFVVSDTGIGMSPEEVAVAIQPFRQVDNTLSKRFEGVGLGLSLAKHLAEIHGGMLEIQSEKGSGTAIRVHLPAQRILQAGETDSTSETGISVAAA